MTKTAKIIWTTAALLGAVSLFFNFREIPQETPPPLKTGKNMTAGIRPVSIKLMIFEAPTHMPQPADAAASLFLIPKLFGD